jgi:DNA-directed RNA polymerase specialized sigma24 family protein
MCTQSDPDSETRLLASLKQGDKSAANELISRYFERVLRSATRRIAERRLRGSGSEDIAASVFESLWQKADQRQFADDDLASANEFWRLLCAMVRFKTEDHLRRERALKRGGNHLRGESVFLTNDKEEFTGLAAFSAKDLAPDDIAACREELQELMNSLQDPILQEVVTLRLEGRLVSEIAEHFHKSERWVKRKLALIREIWNGKLDN